MEALGRDGVHVEREYIPVKGLADDAASRGWPAGQTLILDYIPRDPRVGLRLFDPRDPAVQMTIS